MSNEVSTTVELKLNIKEDSNNNNNIEGELVLLAQENNQEAFEKLIKKYKPLVIMISKQYFLKGGDIDDVIQEGMIGLYNAICSFNPEKSISFYSFAKLCINRQLITAVRTFDRKKHQPLNNSVSLNKPINDEGDMEHSYLDFFPECAELNPESLIIIQENKTLLEKRITNCLTSLETKVIYLYLRGGTYQEISHILGKPEKSIDNALQRAKKKLEKCLV